MPANKRWLKPFLRLFCVETLLCNVEPQDEMLALQRINSYTFLVGYLGFLATWILDTVYSLLHRTGVKATDDAIKTSLRALSPHYTLAR